MTCADFLDRFSEYYDGVLSPAVAAQLDDHRSRCAACERYAGVVDRSLHLLRELPELDPPADMKARVQYRIQIDDERELVGFGPLGSAAATRTVALVAAVLAFTAWAPSVARRAMANPTGALVAPASTAMNPAGTTNTGEPVVQEIELAPFSAGQLSAPDDEAKQLWSYPNAMLYEYSSLSGRNRWRTQEDAFVRAVGLE